MSNIQLDDIEDNEEIQMALKREKIKILGKKLMLLYNSYDGILKFDSQTCNY